ncbi:MAG: hypothetical protein P8188_10965 [Gemmatimonadota bacterium]
MSRPSRILSAPTLGRALAEVAVIVAGVLIALGADAWWTERQEDASYEAAVAALITNVEENLAGLEGERERLSRIIAERTEMILAIRSPESASQEMLDSASIAFFQGPEFLLLDGSLEAVRETAVWSRLPATARTLMARIPKLAELDLADAAAVDLTTTQLSDLLQEYGGWQGLLPREFARDGVDLVFRTQEGDLEGMIRDDRFEHLAIGSVFLAVNAVDRIGEVVQALGELRDILRAELE